MQATTGLIKTTLLVLTLACRFSLQTELKFHDRKPNDEQIGHRVAVVGGGVGGTSSAYFLRQLMPDVDIHLYEKMGHLGGRLMIRDVEGNPYEVGGSIIHPRNRYAVDLVKQLGLAKNDRTELQEKLCIYDGKSFVFCESSWYWITVAKVLLRYGIDPVKLKSTVSKFIDDFERIYDLQKANVFFASVEELLEAMSPNLANLTKTRFSDHLMQSGYSKNFIKELAQAVTLVNYNQDVNIPAFVGSVSYAGAGNDLWSVRNGNVQLPLALAKKSKAKIFLGSSVISIQMKDDNHFELSSVNSNGSVEKRQYQSVIIAMPMVSEIQFVNFTKQFSDKLNLRKYQRTVATLVAGQLRNKFKGHQILSNNPNLFFSSVAKLSPVDGSTAKQPVYKVFSRSPLSNEQFYLIFDEIKHIDTTDWFAYPHYDSITLPLPSFVLSPGLYHVNAIEWAASAIEMSLIGGRNAAILVYHQFGGKTSSVYANRNYKLKSDEL